MATQAELLQDIRDLKYALDLATKKADEGRVRIDALEKLNSSLMNQSMERMTQIREVAILADRYREVLQYIWDRINTDSRLDWSFDDLRLTVRNALFEVSK